MYTAKTSPKIGGWLILVGVRLAVGLFAALTSPGPELLGGTDANFLLLLWLLLVSYFVYLIYLFLCRRIEFIICYIILECMNIVYTMLGGIFGYMTLGPACIYIGGSIAAILYMARSGRVQNTFTRNADSINKKDAD